MGELVKCTKNVCARCKYRCRFGTAPSGAQKLYNFCCNYLEITGTSRIFENGHRRDIEKGYCDKFEPGKPIPAKLDWCDRRRLEDARIKSDSFPDY